jgi:hypothetical protein
MLQSPLPCDGQFILFLLHPRVSTFWGKSGGYILRKKFISLFVGALTSEEV